MELPNPEPTNPYTKALVGIAQRSGLALSTASGAQDLANWFEFVMFIRESLDKTLSATKALRAAWAFAYHYDFENDSMISAANASKFRAIVSGALAEHGILEEIKDVGDDIGRQAKEYAKASKKVVTPQGPPPAPF